MNWNYWANAWRAVAIFVALVVVVSYFLAWALPPAREAWIAFSWLAFLLSLAARG